MNALVAPTLQQPTHTRVTNLIGRRNAGRLAPLIAAIRETGNVSSDVPGRLGFSHLSVS